MRFPNKINAYRSTVVYGMGKLYSILKDPCPLTALLKKAKKSGMDGKDVMDSLLCLYAARKVEFDQEKQEVRRC